jgi:hypothetical protein
MTPSITHLAPQGNKDAKAKKKAAAAEKKKATPKKRLVPRTSCFTHPLAPDSASLESGTIR